MRKLLLLLLIAFFIASCAGVQRERDSFDDMLEDMRAATESAGKWSSYGALGSGAIADGDDFLVRDISDAAPGTGIQKRYTWSNLKTDLSTFDEIEMPNGASLTFDEVGEFGLDTSDEQFIIRGSAGDKVFISKHRQCFTLEDPTDADDNLPIFSLDDGFTVTRLDCIVSGGTSAVVVLNDGTNNLDSMTCGTSETSDTSLSNAVFTPLEKMECDIGTVIGSVNWVRMCFSYTITRE